MKWQKVAPRVGAWIETYLTLADIKLALSHPVWVRGLKQRRKNCREKNCRVAPRVGAWIETLKHSDCTICEKVAPRVGAWIETYKQGKIKFAVGVAPRVGAWIETER